MSDSESSSVNLQPEPLPAITSMQQLNEQFEKLVQRRNALQQFISKVKLLDLTNASDIRQFDKALEEVKTWRATFLSLTEGIIVID